MYRVLLTDIFTDKAATRRLAFAHGVPVCPGRSLVSGETAAGLIDDFGLPNHLREQRFGLDPGFIAVGGELGTILKRWLRSLWNARGGGLYACGYLVTFLWLEVKTIAGELLASESALPPGLPAHTAPETSASREGTMLLVASQTIRPWKTRSALTIVASASRVQPAVMATGQPIAGTRPAPGR